MAGELRILMVESAASDADLIGRHLRKAKISFVSRRAGTKSDYLKALHEFLPHLILSDFRLPRFDAMAALRLAQERAPKVPFIVVAGPTNEEAAADCIKAGATDYVTRERLVRLVPAIKAALKAKEAEGEHRRSEELFRLLFETSPLGIVMSRDGALLYANRTFLQMFGFESLSELQRKAGWIVAQFDDEIAGRKGKNERGSSYEITATRKDGVRFPASVHTTTIQMPDGIASVRFLNEITERKKTEDALRESEERYRRLVELSPDGIAVHSGGKIVFVNSAAVRLMHARNPEELIGKPILDIVHPDYRELVKMRVQEMMQGGKALALIEEKFIRVDGSVVDVEVAAMPFNYGSISATQVVVRDITDRKRAEVELDRSISLLRATLESSADGILVVDEEGRISGFNQRFVEMWRISPDITASRLVSEVWSFLSNQSRNPEEFVAKLKDASSEVAAATVELRDGRIFEQYFRPQIVGGRIVGQVWSYRDVTNQRRAANVQASIYKISTAALLTPNLQELFRSIHEIIGGLMSARNFYIALYDRATDMIHFPYFVDEYDQPPSPHRFKKGLTEYVIRQGASLLASPGVLKRLIQDKEVEPLGTLPIDWLGVPLTTGERTFGSLVVQSYTEGIRFGEEEKNILTFVSDQIALVIERKRAEEELKKNENKYRLLFESNPEAMWVYDCESFVLLAVNDAAIVQYGYSREEFLSMTVDNIRIPAERENLAARLKHVSPRGEILTGFHHRKKDGTIIDVEILAHVIEFEGRKAHLILVKDITEKKLSEEKLRQREEQFRALIENSSDLIALVDDRGSIVYASPSTSRFLGYTLDEFVGRNIFEFIFPEDVARMKKLFAELLQKPGSTIGAQYRMIHKNGATVWMEGMGNNLLDERAVNAIILNYRDITERKIADEVLQEAYDFTQQIISNAGEGIVVYDRDLRYVVWNAFMEKLTGLSSEHVIGKKAVELFPRLYEQGVHNLLERALQGEHQRSSDVFLRVPSTGKSGWVVGAYGPHRNAEGKIIGVIGIITDVTERKRTEEALAKSEERFKLVARATNDAVWDWDLTTNELWWSDSFQMIFGYKASEIEPDVSSWDRRVHPDDRKKVLEETQRALDGGEQSWAGEYRFRRADGSYAIVFDRGYIIRDSKGKPLRVIGSMMDVTERKNLEQQLVQSQKLESIGTLAGGIAHDFNNVLGMILGAAEMLRRHAKSDPRLLRYADMVIESSQRGASIAKQLLLFARSEKLELQPLSLSHVIMEVCELLEHTFPKSIQITTMMDTDEGIILGDSGNLHQVIINLAINAKDAMPDGGTITIRLETPSHDYLRQRFPTIPHGSYVAVSLSDTGVGMDEQTKARIFEPFFSTKERGKGTGLGLAIVHGIVKSHHGYIDVRSEKGKGATFTIYFPVLSQAHPLSQNLQKEKSQGGHETILVVDDEKILREMLVEILTDCGYTVLTAGNGIEAVETYRNNKRTIALVISDLGMPTMGGEELYWNLKGINNDVKVMIATGYIEETSRSELLEMGVKKVIAKPFEIDRVLSSVREVLDGN